MSLLKLLTSGKSLVGLRDSASRYRMSNQKLLPKFGSGKNPFQRSPNGELAPAVVESSGVEAQTTLSTEKDRGQDKEKTGGESLLRLGTSKCRNLAAALQSRWASQLTALLSRPAARPAKVAVRVFGKPPVQGELSLDRIKVVRNDLSDADLEVVAVKSPRPASPAPVVPASQGKSQAAPVLAEQR